MIMKVVIIVLTFISAINTAALPTTGNYVFTGYTDAKCTVSNKVKPDMYMGSSKCWKTATLNSVAATMWDAATKKLTISQYAKDATCAETPIPTASDIMCNGSCLMSASDKTMYYTCLYVDIPVVGYFYMTMFTENTCLKASATAPMKYSSENLCWIAGTASSMVPYSWNAATKTMNIFKFATGDCRGDTTMATMPMKCDGSCMQSADKKTWGTCNWIALPDDSKFNFQGFSDTACATKVGDVASFEYDKGCWATGAKSSIFPLAYTTSSMTISVYSFAMSAMCTGDRTAAMASNFLCDGTCQMDSGSKAYWKCTYMPKVTPKPLTNSGYLVGSFMLLLSVFLF